MEIRIETQRKLAQAVRIWSEIREILRLRCRSVPDHTDMSRRHIQRAALKSQIQAEEAALRSLEQTNRQLESACAAITWEAPAFPSTSRAESTPPQPTALKCVADMRRYVAWTEVNSGLKVECEGEKLRIELMGPAGKRWTACLTMSDGAFAQLDTSPKLSTAGQLLSDLNSFCDFSAFVKCLRQAFLHLS